MSNNSSILTRVFTQSAVKDFLLTESFPELDSVIKRYNIKYDNETKYEEVISEIYQYLEKNYRYEYYYKNTLLNKLIIGVHRVKTTTALTEIPIAKSKADVIMINGKAVVYEIKTELDTFDRLQTQISDYYKAFDHVCVVTSENQAKSLRRLLLDSPVGIYLLTKRGTIRKVQEPEKYSEALDKESIFKILNKAEYERIIQSGIGELPNVTPVNYYKACKQMFCELSIEKIYPAFLKELKGRCRIERIDFSRIPYSLRFLVYFSKFSSHDMDELAASLNKVYKEES